MTARALLLRAAELLEREATALYDSETIQGEWQSTWYDAKKEYDEMIAVALELRRNAGE